MEGSLKKRVEEMKKTKRAAREPRVPSARVKNLMRGAGILRARTEAIARVRAHIIGEVARLARGARVYTQHRHGIIVNAADVQHAAAPLATAW